MENDSLGLQLEKNFTKRLQANEVVVYSTKVQKFNRRDKLQQRNFCISTLHIFNIKGKAKIQRQIFLANIIGISVSSEVDEFVLHWPEEYDYRYISPSMKEIVEMIMWARGAVTDSAFYYWVHRESSLKLLATTKADKKRGFSRIPNPQTATNYEPVETASEEAEESKEILRSPSKSLIWHSESEESTQGTNLDDFNIIKIIGRGSFGKVMLVEHLPTGKKYAMKSIRKHLILSQGQIENTKTEKIVMEHINHPFLNKLEYAFATADKIYFVTEYMRGGELFYHMRQNGRFKEERAKFYAAQVALALAHLHEQGYAYRDLKPENILIDHAGHICITDFGFAKAMPENGVTHSMVGTAVYLAPEIISQQGYTVRADWWSLGILTYEMLWGLPPFYNENNQLLFELILRGEVTFPTRFPISDEAKSFVLALLNRNPNERLGAKWSEEVKLHPWFADINMDLLYRKELTPPFEPLSSGSISTLYVDGTYLREIPENSVVHVNEAMEVMQNQEQFDSFNE